MEIYETLDRRSKSARRSAWFSVMLIVTTVFFMIFFFYSGSNSLLLKYDWALMEEEISATQRDLEASLKNLNLSMGSNDTKVFEDLEKLRLELELKRLELDLETTKLEQSSADARRMTSTITESVTKIGAVLIALYMVQILLSLTRYHFRLADHLAIVAISIKHSDSDIGKIEQFMTAVGTNHIDFGKAPVTPSDKLIEMMKDLPNKIATNKQE